ncbi:MAG: tRNA(His) guanylyltransferase Thg1 family protein [Bacilli bacterium]|nr:tRNA(His) guanylyltransferase Thg1 family protein [Bacilli bacterium]
MKFKTLEDRMLYFRSLSDYKLIPNSYVIIMLDGRSFSKLIKNKFEKPFDDRFIYYMNETAKHLARKIENVKFGYVQSDEISLVLTDFDTETTDSFFANRLCKILSISASIASNKFNQLIINDLINKSESKDDLIKSMQSLNMCEFDCKAWNVPSYNDVYAWFLYRQNDCIKNSKGQTAQTYYSHKELFKLNTDQQIEKLLKEKNIDWNDFDDGKKYGRFIIKTIKEFINDNNETYIRRNWEAINAFPLYDQNNKELFKEISRIPILSTTPI